MNLEQLYLLKLMEECDEASQRASKAIQFGMGEIQKDHLLSNANRLRDEVNDLLAVIKILEERYILPKVSEKELEDAIINKKSKIEKYIKLSRQLGRLN